MEQRRQVLVYDQEDVYTIEVRKGERLLSALRARDVDVYGHLSRWVNCGGRGLCATCGVYVLSESAPVHWHDRMAHKWGYPRLSCQITVEENMEIRIPESKIMWGQLLPDRKKSSS